MSSAKQLMRLTAYNRSVRDGDPRLAEESLDLGGAAEG
jgi:hypothetical protein